ncbi:MAG: glycosyltransferase family 1 protein [Flavobacterium sp.]|nr:MAG: glycosyltransferase family 1 protein [Flavobacterium sp.]
MSKNVLFVVGALHRAGAERFAYEIDLALNKDKFKVSILCLQNKEHQSAKWDSRYYEEKHEALGTKVTYIDEFLEIHKTSLSERIFHKLTRKKFKKNNKEKYKKTLYSYLDKFDVIHWMGEYTFIHQVTTEIKKKSLIHSMCAKFQEPTLYDNYDFNYPYEFISGFYNEEADFEYSEFKNIHHTYFPLALKIEKNKNSWKYPSGRIKKIGIFTRLDKNKPLDPFFYAFQLLLDIHPDTELHIFGNGNPQTEGMLDYLDRLGISEKVFFRGHQEDIAETAINEHLSLSWFQGYNNRTPAGFAGFDICLTGTPLVCWDFFSAPTNPFNNIYPHFKNLNQFVNYTFEILNNKEKSEELSDLQFKDVLANRNIDNFIPELENLYLQLSQRK